MRLSFFPYTQDIAALAKHQTVMKEHTLHSIITFKEDLAQIESFQDKTHTLCTDCIEVGLQGADGLILLFKTIDIQWQKYYDCIDYAVQHSILIFGSHELLTTLACATICLARVTICVPLMAHRYLLPRQLSEKWMKSRTLPGTTKLI